MVIDKLISEIKNNHIKNSLNVNNVCNCNYCELKRNYEKLLWNQIELTLKKHNNLNFYFNIEKKLETIQKLIQNRLLYE